jgi:integrase
METTYEVRIWKTETYKGKRGTTYYVRWSVAGKSRREPFATAALADAFRSELKTAQQNGERFDLESGLPLSKLKAAANISWYDFATKYVDAKWDRSSAHQRRNVADALVLATAAMLRTEPTGYSPRQVRVALREYGFNTARRENAPAEAAAVLNWVRRSSHNLSALTDTATMTRVMDALSTKLNGKPAASSSVRRNRVIFNGAMKYARAENLLTANPVVAIEVKKVKVSRAVDKRSLLDHGRATRILGHIYSRPRGGRRLHAFFSVLYYAGLRPEEAVALSVDDLMLPETGWGEILVHTSASEIGSQWTDSGKARDERGLKGRAEGDTRPVPAHPTLVRVLREYIANPGTERKPADRLKPGDKLFPGERGGDLAGVVYRRAWEVARRATLTEAEYASPLGRRIYDLRHTCLTTWLNSGVPAAQVAAWAGNSVPVLLSTYVNCVIGGDDDLKRRIETALPDQG